jgi:uncharacterized repeat protein (TIGR02543 family)
MKHGLKNDEFRKLALLCAAAVGCALLFGGCPTDGGGGGGNGGPQYTITFNSHEGSAVQPITAYGGTAVAKPADPIKEGSTFAGWFNAETGGAAYTWPHTLTANVTMHAQWQGGSPPPSSQYTVTFHLEGASPVPDTQTVAAGGMAAEPGLITSLLSSAGLYRGAGVDGWYTSAAYTAPWDFTVPVTGNLDLYAQWTAPAAVDISGQSGDTVLEKALAYIAAQTLSVATNYAIVLDAGNYTLPGLSTIGSNTQANIDTAQAAVILAGKGPANISLSSTGALFRITAGRLILDNHITLTKGLTTSGWPLVSVDGSSASLAMKTGAKITGGGGVDIENGSFIMSGGEISDSGSGGVSVISGSFTMSGGEISGNTSFYDAGVSVESGAFIMSGGKISGNTSFYGGGVNVNYGSFIMSGGEISGNTASDDGSGGGVYVYHGSFTMSGGKIFDNTATTTSSWNGGGGVYVDYGASFTMNGGEISDNSAPAGGGVYIGGDFTMSGGKISGNISTSSGGGVSVAGMYGGDFIMSGGEISGNTASGGGGVYIDNGSFTMGSGKISGNTSTSSGGGVYVVSFYNGGGFIMNGGEISGNTASSSGGGVYVGDGMESAYVDSYFRKTGGLIYGDTDTAHTPGSTENTAAGGNTYGHAVYFSAFAGNRYYRDAALNAGDNISTTAVPASGTGNNWTKK